MSLVLYCALSSTLMNVPSLDRRFLSPSTVVCGIGTPFGCRRNGTAFERGSAAVMVAAAPSSAAVGVLSNVELRINRFGAMTAFAVIAGCCCCCVAGRPVFGACALLLSGAVGLRQMLAMRLLTDAIGLLKFELLRDGGVTRRCDEAMLALLPPPAVSDALLFDRCGTLGVLGDR